MGGDENDDGVVQCCSPEETPCCCLAALDRPFSLRLLPQDPPDAQQERVMAQPALPKDATRELVELAKKYGKRSNMRSAPKSHALTEFFV